MPGTVRLALDVGVALGVAARALASGAAPESRVASTAITASRTTTAASPAASRRRDPRTPGSREIPGRRPTDRRPGNAGSPAGRAVIPGAPARLGPATR